MANDSPATSATSELDTFLASIPVGFRKQRFHDLAQGLLAAERPIVILETGCIRPHVNPLDPPENDGCSTLVWDWIARTTRGTCITVDIDPANADYARSKVSPCTKVYCADSLAFLISMRLSQPIDLLYLDSMDWTGTAEQKNLSALHHAAELSAAWRWLNHGAIIAVDDCHDAYTGKHALVRRFFDSLGVPPLADDYIHVWQKPMSTPVQFALSVPSK